MPASSLPQPGDIAPDIRAMTTAGPVFDLASHRGSWVVVYFYPRANTPG